MYIGNYNVTPQREPNGFTIAELFAGGGLMAVGLRQAGYRIVWANDFDPKQRKDRLQPQVLAYMHNIGNHIVQQNITQIDPDSIPDVDVIAGGPPCQDYSVAGNGEGEDGERGKLVWTYLNVIERKQPKAFVFENVKGLVGKRHRQTFDSLLAQFDAIGYNVSWRLVNAWDYGVAQKRERVFIVGIRKDIGFTFKFPEPEASGYRTQVLRDVCGDLPEPVFSSNPESDHYAPYEPHNHHAEAYWTPKREYSYDQANRVQSMEAPSNTIPAHHNSGQPIHPTQAPRRFTVRECLRIQSVPDWYVIPPEIKLGASYRIVGNGVASRVAYVLGVSLADQLRSAFEQETKEAV